MQTIIICAVLFGLATIPVEAQVSDWAVEPFPHADVIWGVGVGEDELDAIMSAVTDLAYQSRVAIEQSIGEIESGGEQQIVRMTTDEYRANGFTLAAELVNYALVDAAGETWISYEEEVVTVRVPDGESAFRGSALTRRSESRRSRETGLDDSATTWTVDGPLPVSRYRELMTGASHRYSSSSTIIRLVELARDSVGGSSSPWYALVVGVSPRN